MKLFFILLFLPLSVFAEQINIELIAKIETNNNYAFYEPILQKRGVCALSIFTLSDYNCHSKDEDYRIVDLFSPPVNKRIADWLYNTRIPFLLQRIGAEVTIENIFRLKFALGGEENEK